MRLSCNVKILSQVAGTPTSNNSTFKASIGLGQKSRNGDIYFTVNSSRNRTGDFYKVQKNVSKLHNAYSTEGKCTIRFCAPAHDVYISKADPLQLKMFLKALRQSIASNNFDCQPVPILRKPSTKVLNSSSEITITTKAEYAKASSFPTTLPRLTINFCNLRRIDSRILNIYLLKKLNLEDNEIASLPETMDPNCLKHLNELILCRNLLNTVPSNFLANFGNTLGVLDLRSNLLKELPDSLCRLKNLRILNCSHNPISKLPNQIGSLINLKELRVSHTRLTYIPGSIRKLRLQHLDLAGNNFNINRIKNEFENLEFPLPSLKECAAKSVVKHRIIYTEKDVPRSLCDYLKTYEMSACGTPCFENFVLGMIPFDIKYITETLVFEFPLRTGSLVPMEMVMCCRKCVKDCKRN